MDPDRQADLAALDSTLTTVERVLDVDAVRTRIEKLEQEASDPNLWDDQARAQKVTSELSHTQGELRRVEHVPAVRPHLCFGDSRLREVVAHHGPVER